MSTRSKLWIAAVLAALAVQLAAAFVLPQSFRLTAISDLTQCLLLLSGTASFLPLALRARGRIRLFWSLVALGVAFWFCYQLLWTYYEVVLRRDVPDLYTGDIVLFLHIVPFMAAVALRPHLPQDEYAARLGRLDFALLLVWWFYLYVLTVLPWQYAVPNVEAYNSNLNAVYNTEKCAFLAGLCFCWAVSQGGWRKLYASLFGMSFSYAASSTLANWAIARNTYYSGSFYDVPLAGAMAWLTWIGLRAKVEAPQSRQREVSTVYGVWVARCGMIAVFSLPLFAVWAMSDTAVPARIRSFRLVLTLGAAFFMGVMVLVRQRLLDRELIRLLSHSEESFDSLKRLQVQIVHSEKLASIGQLVGGAAHELNNPITAMLGYSDLLLSTPLTTEQERLAAKIGQCVRRSKSLVAGLISFAHQAPTPRTPIDLNTLARTAVKLTQPQWQALGIEVRTQFDSTLPKVLGDSNQLLQVCLQLLANCVHVMSECGSKVLTVSTENREGSPALQIAAESPASASASDRQRISPADAKDSLALSACQGILQEHNGRICCEPRPDGAVILRVELPAAEGPSALAKQTTLSGLWPTQPYA
ncbi:MAG TPA: histidine kinase dimerization/phospho-acceptor domain-containing protein [Candidatus Sulfotelmatobacter sp.]|nr:histidine kinase dimerization/phospho-acceptor domain-containing protein [Candidatus Sulfotelmatobacter sp.]